MLALVSLLPAAHVASMRVSGRGQYSPGPGLLPAFEILTLVQQRHDNYTRLRQLYTSR